MQIQKSNTCYDEVFYTNLSTGSYRSARQVAPLVMQHLKPQSVLDVGCGTGTWLKVFAELGADIMGIDGAYVDRRQLMIASNQFYPMDLKKPIVLEKKVRSRDVAGSGGAFAERKSGEFYRRFEQIGRYRTFFSCGSLTRWNESHQ